jgi:hypothetical protein
MLSILVTLLAAYPQVTLADQPGWIDLSELESWKEPHGAWLVAGDAALSSTNPKQLDAKPGKGVIVNGPDGRKCPDLLSREKYGDVEVHLGFMVPQRSNSGIKLHGHYEIQIFDSFGVKEPTASDCGGIYPRAELLPRYRHIDKGFPPKVNACKAPGEWQTLELIFLAPRFDAEGKKIANARFTKVLLNGQLIHDNVEVPTPTGHAWRNAEMAVGPLLLQADHGPVAFRDIRVRPIAPKK